MLQVTRRHFGLVILLVLLGFHHIRAQELIDLFPPDGELPSGAALPEDGVEILMRGPVHEAFAAASAREPDAGPIVPRKPPADIQELPPVFEANEQTGDQTPTWIPGYWAWDEERSDFLWVSGAWRIAPQGRHWIPGYWAESSGGWRWVSGLWAVESFDEIRYAQRPPASLDVGPSVPPPSENYFWIPGVWVHDPNVVRGGYQWQPGSWCAYREGFVWIPSHYVYTPYGCIFVSGYWDFLLPARGQLYAPVYFQQPIVTYRPSCPIQTANLLLHLFVSIHHNHYLFGDYYDDAYRDRGCYPFYDYHRATRGYDPLFSYYTIHFARRGINCHAHLRRWHDYYVTHTHSRPPRNWSAHINLALGNARHARPPQSTLVAPQRPMARAGADPGHRMLNSATAKTERLQRLAGQRQQLESAKATLTQAERRRNSFAKTTPQPRKVDKELRIPRSAALEPVEPRRSDIAKRQALPVTKTPRVPAPVAQAIPSPGRLSRSIPTSRGQNRAAVRSVGTSKIKMPSDRFTEVHKRLKGRLAASQEVADKTRKLAPQERLRLGTSAQPRPDTPKPVRSRPNVTRPTASSLMSSAQRAAAARTTRIPVSRSRNSSRSEQQVVRSPHTVAQPNRRISAPTTPAPPRRATSAISRSVSPAQRVGSSMQRAKSSVKRATPSLQRATPSIQRKVAKPSKRSRKAK